MKNTLWVRFLFLFLLCPILLSGCNSSKNSSADEPPVYSPLKVLEPEAPGKETIGNPPVVLDLSNKGQGYLTAQVQDSDSRIHIQMTGPDGVLYSYFIDVGDYAVIPFTSGNGTYQILCYQQLSNDRYAALYSESLEITLDNPFLPFLYPNQYVNFSPESQACLLAQSMLPDDAEDVEGLEAVFDYVISQITYDEEKAQNVEAGYLPDIDETLTTGKGICFDYAALMTAMLRARDIPCKLQIGYTGDIKHAWIDVYIRSKGWVNQAIVFDGETWTRMDPTFESGADDSETIREYIGDGSNYTVQFTR